MEILFENNKIYEPTCMAIGVFDGVHLGHRFLLEMMQKSAFASGLKSFVVTFKNHPQNFFYPQNNFKLLTTETEKVDLVSEINPDFILLLDFDKRISAMKAADFLLFLKKNYSLKKLIIGYNHSFGADKIKDFEQYKKIGESLDIEVEQCPPLPHCHCDIDPESVKKAEIIEKAISGHTSALPSSQAHNENVSSSNIRNLLLNGDIEKANAMLGTKYFLNGTVQHGEKIGRTIGFPTANLEISTQKLIPKDGVYSVEVSFKNFFFNGMLCIGNRPTVSGKNQSVEVNIFDFNEDIYNQKIKIFFNHFIRENRKFDNLQQLKNQIEKDKEDTIMKKH